MEEKKHEEERWIGAEYWLEVGKDWEEAIGFESW